MGCAVTLEGLKVYFAQKLNTHNESRKDCFMYIQMIEFILQDVSLKR